jgi:hypothetical protein
MGACYQAPQPKRKPSMETVHSGTTAGNQRNSRRPTSSTTVSARVLPDGHTFTVTGRAAWMLQQLMAADKTGVTAAQHPGARIAHYVFLLRREGLIIETIHESHGGPFPGSHARYRLASDVSIINQRAAA